jgi:hypothetical protein
MEHACHVIPIMLYPRALSHVPSVDVASVIRQTLLGDDVLPVAAAAAVTPQQPRLASGSEAGDDDCTIAEVTMDRQSPLHHMSSSPRFTKFGLANMIDRPPLVICGLVFMSGAACGRGLHSSTLQLNVSAFCVTGGASRGCFGGV